MVDVLGARLNRYEIRTRIGKGGMAAVYKAWDTNLDRTVAVKVLHTHLSDDADFKSRFEREAKLVAGLNHPNIVQVYDFDSVQMSDETIYYMVMAYVPGATLRQVMEQRRAENRSFTLTEIGEILRQIVSALSYAHSRGMVHRDVTPGNILFNEDKQVVLADFGIARMIEGTRVTRTGTTSGTPIYMSPEQSMGEGGDHRSDIYSLGIILFELLTGRAPYEGDSAFAILMKHVNEPVPEPTAFVSLLPAACDEIVAKALAKDPDQRYQSVNDILYDFETKVLGKTVSAALSLPRPAPSADSLQAKRRSGGTTRVPAATRVLPAFEPPKQRVGNWFFVVGGTAVVLVIIAVVLVLTDNIQVIGINDPPTAAALNVPPISQTRRAAPSMASGPKLFEDFFNEERNGLFWEIETADPQLYRNIEEGVYRIRNQVPSAAITSLFDPEGHNFGDGYRYTAELTIDAASQPDSATGIVFRYRYNQALGQESYYLFGVNGLGRYSLWKLFDGQWRELRDMPEPWTANDAIKGVGEKNTVVLEDRGRTIRGYVNGEMMVEYSESAGLDVWSSGAIGIYLATTQSPVEDPLALVEVDRFKVDEIILPTRTPRPSPIPSLTPSPTRRNRQPTQVKSATFPPTETPSINDVTSIPPTNIPPTQEERTPIPPTPEPRPTQPPVDNTTVVPPTDVIATVIPPTEASSVIKTLVPEPTNPGVNNTN